MLNDDEEATKRGQKMAKIIDYNKNSNTTHMDDMNNFTYNGPNDKNQASNISLLPTMNEDRTKKGNFIKLDTNHNDSMNSIRAPQFSE